MAGFTAPFFWAQVICEEPMVMDIPGGVVLQFKESLVI